MTFLMVVAPPHSPERTYDVILVALGFTRVAQLVIRDQSDK